MDSTEKKIRLMLVDDQRIFLEGLAYVIESRAEDITIVGQALDGREAIALVDETKPDIILMDVRMPNLDGVKATKIIHEKYPHIKIVMFTTFQDDDYVKKALSYGAIGYLLKNRPPMELIHSLHAVVSGIMQIDPEVAVKLIDRGVNKPIYEQEMLSQYRSLTLREKDTLNLLLQAYDNKEIAEQLNIQEQSVRNYIHNIYSKMGFSNRYEIIKVMDILKFFIESGF